MNVYPVPTPGLGDTSYVAAHESTAVLIDPQRDIDRFLDLADELGVTITHVFDTHVHNDYVSGARQAARRLDADLVLPAASGASFPHVEATDDEELDSQDGLKIRPIHTPGHTPEHMSYLLSIDDEPRALFSGGSLLVGSAGRTDLLGSELAEGLARRQHGSLRLLAELPGDVAVLPTHGAGSFCVTTPAGGATSTIAQEVASNPLLALEAESDFVAAQLQSLRPFPDYYAHMAPINRAGPGPMPPVEVPEMSPDEFEGAMTGAEVIDGRLGDSFLAGAVPGSLGIELGSSFASWVGWLVPFAKPLLLVLDADQDVAVAATELARIGYDDVIGVMRGSDAWSASGRDLTRFEALSEADAVSAHDTGAALLDVRDPMEWEADHLEESIHCYLPDLRGDLPGGLVPGEELVVMCSSGFRATIAAGLLARRGLSPGVVVSGGVPGMLAMGQGDA